MDVAVIDPRSEARERIARRYDVRVLEPSPPALADAPWFADDPVALEDASPASVVTPVPTPGARTWDDLARSDESLAAWCAERWLGAWPRLDRLPDVDTFTATRRGWHALAEHVVAPARHRANGKIGLRFTRGGFGSPFFGKNEQVRVAGRELVVIHDGAGTRHPLTTIGAAADAVGASPGAAIDVYTPTTPLEPDEPLRLDDASSRLLGEWFGFACSVLEELRVRADRTDTPARVQLWPEHFDLSVDLGDEAAGARGTYGASPGDDAHPEPYLYVTPWTQQPDDPVWNDSTFPGASLALGELVAADDQRRAALDLFAGAHDVLHGPARTTPA
jgi:hypothetical protein